MSVSLKGRMPDPNDSDQIRLVATIIRDNEFGCATGDWDRVLARAQRDNDTYAASIVYRIYHTARHVLAALEEATRPYSPESKTPDTKTAPLTDAAGQD